MKVIIAGSRGFNDYEVLAKVCDYMLQNQDKSEIEIVSGTARGADQLGERYAEDRNYKITRFPADWENLGKKAGYVRNAQMAEYSDALIAFWDGESKGTLHMINLAKEHGLKVKVHRFGEQIE
ncbi:hypothetical protein BKI52_32945 [marine bacterium AO1-C]|nr:hypothetical protein BKI52_32945 [marine bacterium AO1-C]